MLYSAISKFPLRGHLMSSVTTTSMECGMHILMEPGLLARWSFTLINHPSCLLQVSVCIRVLIHAE